MKKRLVFLILAMVTVAGTALAQNYTPAQIFRYIYGTTRTGCDQWALVATNQSRTSVLTTGKWYLVYGIDTATFAGVTIRCVVGNSSVDVTALDDSKKGEIFFAGQQTPVLVPSGTGYISCALPVTASDKAFETCIQE